MEIIPQLVDKICVKLYNCFQVVEPLLPLKILQENERGIREMISYVIKRVAAAVATIFLVSVITFFVMNAIPGSPFLDEHQSFEQRQLAEAKYGLDKPLIIQYKNYLVNFFHGDLGVSLKLQKDTPVRDIIFNQGKFALTIRIGATSLFVIVFVGIILGCIMAYNRGKWIDSVLGVFCTIGIAIPTFVIATIMLTIFSLKLGWLPAQSNGLTDIKAYIMPVIALSMCNTCTLIKLTRTSMLDSINQDYIRTAKAKGLKTKMIIFKHALRNSLIPVVTYLGPLVAGVLTGGFVTETTFGIPGIAKYFVDSIINRDYPVIMATTIILSSLVIGMNLVVDLVYMLIDPRIALSRKGA